MDGVIYSAVVTFQTLDSKEVGSKTYHLFGLTCPRGVGLLDNKALIKALMQQAPSSSSLKPLNLQSLKEPIIGKG